MNITKAREELLLGKTIYDMNLKVADYGRVSTDKDEQTNSLENQKNYFQDFINGVKNWKHVNSYIDEGISGTQVYKRDQFLKMIEDARLGKIDLILTKEVSRFARNTIDSIKYTELLLNYGVAVFFISDNINTIYKDSEFRLTLMASMAQDEVRKISERVKFGIKRSIKDGKVLGGGIYGYNKKNSKLIINEEEANVVRMIFTMYKEGIYGLKKMGELLAKRNLFTRKGNVFSDTSLKKIIKNPRYKGWYTANLSEVEDYKTHKRIFKNKNEWILYKDQSGRIPPIVSSKLWEEANEMLNKRTKIVNKNKKNNKYTSKIICKEHNKSFIRSASSKRKNNPVWQCNEYLRHGLKGCSQPKLFEKQLDEIFYQLFNEIIINKEKLINEILDDYTNIINKSDNFSIEKIINKNKLQKEKLLDLLLRNVIDEKTYNYKIDTINKEIEILNNKSNNDDNTINLIKQKLYDLFDIKKNIKEYFNLFINKVFVKKINKDKVELQIIFNYNREDLYINLDLNNK